MTPYLTLSIWLALAALLVMLIYLVAEVFPKGPHMLKPADMTIESLFLDETQFEEMWLTRYTREEGLDNIGFLETLNRRYRAHGVKTQLTAAEFDRFLTL